MMRIFARLLSVKPRLLYMAVLILCVAGSYAVQNSFDIVLMIVFGMVGYFFTKLGIPPAPMMFGLVLGPLLEENLRRTLVVYESWSVFFTRPICIAMLIITAALLLYPLLSMVRRFRSTNAVNVTSLN